jgi:hypothetical protein
MGVDKEKMRISSLSGSVIVAVVEAHCFISLSTL